MNTQELRRLGVLPYEDAPRPVAHVREAWVAPAGVNRGEVLQGMTVTRQAVQAQGRTLRDTWTMETAPEIVNLVSDELANELTAEIDTEIIQEINRTMMTNGIQPNPFQDEEFDDWPPNEQTGIDEPSFTQRLTQWFNRTRGRNNDN